MTATLAPAPTASQPSRLLTARELADRIGVPLSKIYRLSSEGRLPKYKSGHRTVRFDLDEVLAALRVEPGAAPPTPLPSPSPGTDPIEHAAARIACRIRSKKS